MLWISGYTLVLLLGAVLPVLIGAAPKGEDGMVLVPAGRFLMGSRPSEGQKDESPQQEVVLAAFRIDKTEVTNAQYGEFLAWIRKTKDHGRCHPGEPTAKDHTPGAWEDATVNGPNHPVVGVDWYDAWAYAAWAGKRLPTEAEWEKAARGADGRKYPWGNEFDVKRVNCAASAGFDATAPAGHYVLGASPYGCLEMAGNAWEWTSSLYRPYPYRADDGREDPKAAGPRVVRGGSWNDSFDDGVRCAVRYPHGPAHRLEWIGFRCARSADATGGAGK